MTHETRLEKANEIINYHVLYSSGAGLIPIPLADIAAVTAIQLDMLKQLCKLYGVDFSESSGKSWISAITGSTLARIGASYIKAIPGIGSFIGGLSMSALSGASTYGIGQVFISYYYEGGDLENIDKEAAKRTYKQEFKKGTKYIEQMEKNKKAKTTKEDVFETLKKLAELKEKGIISEEEYAEQKKKLLEKI